MYLKRALMALTALTAVGAFLYFVNPAACWWAPKCPFKLLTGLNCPACGIQRFIHTLLTGHPAKAIAYNYFLVYALPYASAFGMEWLLRDSRLKQRLAAIIESRVAVWTYVVSFMAWLVIRNIFNI